MAALTSWYATAPEQQRLRLLAPVTAWDAQCLAAASQFRQERHLRRWLEHSNTKVGLAPNAFSVYSAWQQIWTALTGDEERAAEPPKAWKHRQQWVRRWARRWAVLKRKPSFGARHNLKDFLAKAAQSSLFGNPSSSQKAVRWHTFPAPFRCPFSGSQNWPLLRKHKRTVTRKTAPLLSPLFGPILEFSCAPLCTSRRPRVQRLISTGTKRFRFFFWWNP